MGINSGYFPAICRACFLYAFNFLFQLTGDPYTTQYDEDDGVEDILGGDGVDPGVLEQAKFLGLVADQSLVETIAWCKHVPGTEHIFGDLLERSIYYSINYKEYCCLQTKYVAVILIACFFLMPKFCKFEFSMRKEDCN